MSNSVKEDFWSVIAIYTKHLYHYTITVLLYIYETCAYYPFFVNKKSSVVRLGTWLIDVVSFYPNSYIRVFYTRRRAQSSEDDTKSHVNLYRWSFPNNSLFDLWVYNQWVCILQGNFFVSSCSEIGWLLMYLSYKFNKYKRIEISTCSHDLSLSESRQEMPK